MRIYIPSRSRHDRVSKRGRTLMELARCPELRGAISVVCPRDQYVEYAKSLPPKYNIELIGCPVDGISLTRQWIAQVAADRGEDHFCMMDDDLGFLVRKEAGKWQLRPQEPNETVAMIRYIKALLVHGYGAVGVSPREGNNRFTECPNENTRLIRVLAFNTKEFLACEHGRVDVMEDFDILLQMLRRGLPNAMTVKYAQGQRQTQEAGGCSDYRSHEIHEASAIKLSQLHEGFVRLREKKNISGGEFGTRKEVTIQWKKAYDSSLQGAVE